MHLMTLFLVSLGLLLLPTVAHAPPAYTVAEIGGLAGLAEVYPAAVNSAGHVVGTARDLGYRDWGGRRAARDRGGRGVRLP